MESYPKYEENKLKIKYNSPNYQKQNYSTKERYKDKSDIYKINTSKNQSIYYTNLNQNKRYNKSLINNDTKYNPISNKYYTQNNKNSKIYNYKQRKLEYNNGKVSSDGSIRSYSNNCTFYISGSSNQQYNYQNKYQKKDYNNNNKYQITNLKKDNNEKPIINYAKTEPSNNVIYFSQNKEFIPKIDKNYISSYNKEKNDYNYTNNQRRIYKTSTNINFVDNYKINYLKTEFEVKPNQLKIRNNTPRTLRHNENYYLSTKYDKKINENKNKEIKIRYKLNEIPHNYNKYNYNKKKDSLNNNNNNIESKYVLNKVNSNKNNYNINNNIKPRIREYKTKTETHSSFNNNYINSINYSLPKNNKINSIKYNEYEINDINEYKKNRRENNHHILYISKNLTQEKNYKTSTQNNIRGNKYILNEYEINNNNNRNKIIKNIYKDNYFKEMKNLEEEIELDDDNEINEVNEYKPPNENINNNNITNNNINKYQRTPPSNTQNYLKNYYISNNSSNNNKNISKNISFKPQNQNNNIEYISSKINKEKENNNNKNPKYGSYFGDSNNNYYEIKGISEKKRKKMKKKKKKKKIL